MTTTGVYRAVKRALKEVYNEDIVNVNLTETEVVEIKDASSSNKLSVDSSGRAYISIQEDAVGLAKETTLSSKLDAIINKMTATSEQIINGDGSVDQSITLDTEHRKLLEVYATCSSATTFTLEFSTDGTNWITYYTSATAETSYSDTLWNGFRYARLKSTGTGTAGDTVTLILSAKP